ncbi:MAG: 4Fe-4S binding protein [Desulfobacterales bacterium]|nr:4Fe-4S binding protein [Desulfobacterales bacterium]
MSYQISDDCIGCGACAKKCPQHAIEGKPKKRFDIDPFLCIECGVCFNTCPKGAIIDPFGRRPLQKGKKAKITKAKIERKLCAGCKNCLLNCPQNAIKTAKQRNIFASAYCIVDKELCSGCARCTGLCITGAVELE